MSDDVLICSLVEEQGHVIEGSIIASCSECEKDVWIAPSGQKIVAEKNPILYCIPCGVTLMMREKFEVIPPSKEQLREVVESLRKKEQ